MISTVTMTYGEDHIMIDIITEDTELTLLKSSGYLLTRNEQNAIWVVFILRKIAVFLLTRWDSLRTRFMKWLFSVSDDLILLT